MRYTARVLGSVGDQSALDTNPDTETPPFGLVLLRLDGTIDLELYDPCPPYDIPEAQPGTLYTIPIPVDVLAEHDWIDVKGLASYQGLSVADLQAASIHADPLVRAELIASVQGYDSLLNFDGYPQALTRAEICKRWRSGLRTLDRRETRRWKTAFQVR